MTKKMLQVENKMEYIIKYIKNTLLMYVVWTILWLPYLYNMYRSIYDSIQMVLICMFRRILFAGQGVYWYLLVLAESTFVIGILSIRKKEILLYVISIMGFLLNILYVTNISTGILGLINRLFYIIFSWESNFIMVGIPFMTIGYMLAKTKVDMNRIALAIAYIIVTIINVGWYLMLNDTINPILYALQAIIMFIFALQFKGEYFERNISISLRDISSYTYFVHTIFIYYIVDVYIGLRAPTGIRYSVTIGLVMFSYAIVKLVNFKPLNWLLSISDRACHIKKMNKQN